MSDTSAYQLPQRGSHLNKGDEGSDNELWEDVYSVQLRTFSLPYITFVESWYCLKIGLDDEFYVFLSE